MKTLMMAPLTMIALAGSQVAQASTWNGAGTVYDKDRNVESTYSLEVNIQAGANGAEHTVVKVTANGQTVYTQTCDQKNGDHRWSKTCDDGGSGGGYLFDNGLGTDYYRTTDGKAFATTIVLDAADKMRLERVELDAGGQALHFYSETLTETAK